MKCLYRQHGLDRQHGLALAEWTLAALLGALLLATALAWLQSSLQMALWQRVPLQMTESAGWLLQRFAREALQAGQGGVHPVGLDEPALAPWWPDNGRGPGLAASDQLLLQRQLKADTLDCEGTRVVAGQRLLERYFLRTDSAAAGWVLACDAGVCTASGCQRLGDAGVALQGELDGFQVRYGLAEQPPLTVRYVDAVTLRAMTPAPRVVSLRIALLLHGIEPVSRRRRWQPPADWFGPVPPASNDRLLRDVWQMTLEVPHGQAG